MFLVLALVITFSGQSVSTGQPSCCQWNAAVIIVLNILVSINTYVLIDILVLALVIMFSGPYCLDNPVVASALQLLI